jgi:hypothetical protein
VVSPTQGKVIKQNRSSSSSSKEAESPTSPTKTISLNKTVKLINSHLKTPSNDGDANDDRKKEDSEEQPMVCREKFQYIFSMQFHQFPL